MTTPSSHHPSRWFGGRKSEPVCSEPELSSYTAEHFKRNAAAAERHRWTADGVRYDDSADHLDWYGIGLDPNRPLDPAYLLRPELYPRIAKDNRAYTVVSVAIGVVLATAISAVAVAWFVRGKPVTIEAMPVHSVPCNRPRSENYSCQ